MKANIIILIMLVFWSCKDNTSKKTEVAESVTEVKTINQSANVDAFYPMLNQMDLSTMEVAAYRKSATDIVHHRNKENGRKASPILTKDSWQYEGIFRGSNFVNADSLKQTWITFKDDLTYEYGKNKEKKGGGIYAYNFDTGLLHMVDNDGNIKPNEYNVKIHNDLIILEGQATYKDNNIQAKLVRSPPVLK
ncbi:MAG: hypothetical protein IPN79_01955 [Saprospiraceae bacterium]|nr:hypothetical protein [Saprospiraceae bacterium]